MAYSSMNVIVQVITMVREFAVRWILPPQIMGFWNLSVVVQRFVSIFDLGCIAGATRELPIVRGKGNSGEEAILRSTTFWFTLIQNAAVSLFAVLYIVWNRSDYAGWGIMAAVVGITIFLIMSVQTVFTTFFAAAHDFVTLSKLLVIGALIDGAAFPVFALIWGLKGLMTAAVAGACIKSALFFLSGGRKGLDVKSKLSPKASRELLSFGFVLRVVDYPNALFNIADIIWVTKLMGIEALAFFSLAKSFFLQMSDVSTRIGTVYTMHYLEQSGKGMSREFMAEQLKRFLFFQLLVVVPVLSWAAGTVLPFIVRNFIPEYSASNRTFLVLLACGFFYVLNSGLTNPWVMDKKLFIRGAANTAGLLMMAGALFVTWFILGRRTINSVACATLSGYFLYFVYMVFAVGKGMWKPSEKIEITLSVAVAAAWTFSVIWIGQYTAPSNAGLVSDLKYTFLTALWTAPAILLVVLYGLKKADVIRALKRKGGTDAGVRGDTEVEAVLYHE